MSLPNYELQQLATQLRVDVMQMLLEAGSGHAAGPLSAADLFAFLYFEYLKHDPHNPDLPDRDYFLVSNGHICSVWYAALARSGYFPIDELKNFRKFGSILQGHPWNLKTPGVFNSSGMLGHGEGQAVGVALGLRLDGKPNKVICFTSDGEHQEGSVWEAVMSAGNFGLENLTFIVDKNGVQIDKPVDEVMWLDDPHTQENELVDKYLSFGWSVVEINGHNFDHIRRAFDEEHVSGKPKVIIAHTVAGKGVTEIEGDPKYHDWRGDIELAQRAIEELKKELV